jgi:hypothetical protein
VGQRLSKLKLFFMPFHDLDFVIAQAISAGCWNYRKRPIKGKKTWQTNGDKRMKGLVSIRLPFSSIA